MGQQGLTSTHNNAAGGGGGGSFVIKPPKNSTNWNERSNLKGRHLLIAAGGGAGSLNSTYNDPIPVGGAGDATNTGTYTSSFTGGNQGSNYHAGAGGGFLTRGLAQNNASRVDYAGEGARDPSGYNHFRGGENGYQGSEGDGGFGVGGGGSSYAPGGGGGAWGGNGGNGHQSNGTGGSSYSYNTPSVQTSGARQGHGQIIITAVNTPKTLAGGNLGDYNIDPNGWFQSNEWCLIF